MGYLRTMTNGGLPSFMLRAARLAIVSILFTACISGSRNQPYPLHPNTDPPPAREQLAHLLGYVQVVDGRDVSTLGSSFNVLPGPHMVQTPSRWAHTELNVGGMYWITGHLTGGDTYRGHIHAYESNPEGVVTRDFYPIASHEGA